ncbi:MAG TPA: ATP synthase F0 subunit B, partial [Thermodesulfobacteriota bacterium]|nr:ATP synthase F0 subunit B [Thermodesulfobacteriota bacterium]
MIELNITFLYQIAGFIALYFILNTLLYKPVLKTLEERYKKGEGKKKEALDLEAVLRKRLLDYENRLNEPRVKAQEERLRLKQEGLDKEQEILENARKNSQSGFLEAKTKLKEEAKSAP